MESKPKSTSHYVEKVRQKTRAYIQELLDENENLRRRNAWLETDIEDLRSEKVHLLGETLTLRKELDEQSERHQRLCTELDKAENRSRAFSERYVEVEEQNNNLAHLYVAGYRLRETASDRKEVLTALQEIVINLIGSEEFAVFERPQEGAAPSLTVSFGLDPDRLARFDLATSPADHVLKTGDSFLDTSSENDDARPVACVPLLLGKKVYGVIVIFSVLPHKQGLQPLDYELFDLLASQAASSLFIARSLPESQQRDLKATG